MRRILVFGVLLFWIALIFIFRGQLSAQIISQVNLISDTRQLAETLEAVHPDPYKNGGGKIEFHRKLHNILESIPEEGMTSDEYYKLVCPLTASIGDMHTWIYAPYKHNWMTGPWGVPLYLKIVENSLYIGGVYNEDQRDLLGRKLIAIEGVSVEELMNRERQRIGVENDYGLLRDMAKFGVLMQAAYLEHLLPEWTDQSKINITVASPEGKISSYDLPIPGTLSISSPIGFKSDFKLPSRENCDFVYEFLDSNHQTALLVVDGMMSYREAFEMWHAMGVTNHDERAEELYMMLFQEPPPDNIDETIAKLPSATEVFKELVIEMKQGGTKNLLIDLRRNDGGNSYMSEILVYLLYGREAFLRPRANSLEIRKYSQPFFEYFSGESLDKINAGRSYPLTVNDYDFKQDYVHGEPVDLQTVAANFEEEAALMKTFFMEYRSGKYEAYYTPENVIVLSSPYTFSSGFTLLKKLYQAGAKILGTPSAQAANCYGDIMNFKLNHSHIRFSVSRKYFESFPDNPELGKILMPDYSITYNILAEYNYDPQVEILYALDLVNLLKE